MPYAGPLPSSKIVSIPSVKDILSTSPQLSTSPRRKSSPEIYSRKLSLKVDLSSTQQQFISEMSPCLLRKKSGEIIKPSLKRGKSEPVTPTFSCFPKYVRFDSTNLEQVKLFDGAKRPQAVSAEASSDEDTDNSDEFDFSIPTLPQITTEHCSKYVFVESIFLSTDKRKLQGRVHVKNIAFQKIVRIRYTFDFWQTVSEVTAKYATTSTTNVEGGTTSSPPAITKNMTKKSNRYDFSVSLSAAKNLTPTTPLTPGDDPIHQYFPTISYGNENYNSFFPGNYIDGMPSTTEISTSSWDDVKSSSNPIAIPSTKSPIGSSAYYDLVNQYCFYQGSPYTAGSPYAGSPYTSSPFSSHSVLT
ncbi:8802_t:CDS:2 [Diversispora eburnea]|uniref:8802_t:CDS:1 n=1 Tax=Diversispora eburnea TaxID=1213867 RepID=A0A9N9A5C2_9GLOM|nr:8802_t:CDS:2 [Diversispora eburnea]